MSPLTLFFPLLAAAFFVISGASPARAETLAPVPAFGAGAERLVYAIKWGPFNAGRAVLEIHPDPRVGQAGGYRLELTAHTSGLFKRIYPLDVWIRSTLTADLRRSLDFRKVQNDRNTRIRFDWDKGTAQYVRDGEAAEPIALPSSALDPLALVMAVRNQALAVGSSLKTFFTDGKRSVEGSAGVLREERIDTEAGPFDTVVVRPVLRDVGGVFSRSRNPSMTVWISRDARHLPVRISSKIMLGSLVGELVEVRTFARTAE